MLEEGGVGRTAKMSPVGRSDVQEEGTDQKKLENRSSEAKQRELVSLGKILTWGFSVSLHTSFPHRRCEVRRLGRESGRWKVCGQRLTGRELYIRPWSEKEG